METNGRKVLTAILIGISGILVFFIANWNSNQAELLTQWAAEREGKAAFTRMVHENGMSPGMFFQAPELLETAIASDSEIAAAGIMLGQNVLASFSKALELEQYPAMKSLPIGATILSEQFTLYRKHSGPGSGGGGRWHGGGQGPPWMRSQNDDPPDPENRISFYLVFKGPDKELIAPLIYQKYLWPVVWLIGSLLWLTILYNQYRMAELQQAMQKEAHLVAIGKMSARLAHEIKNPLGAIRGMSQFLDKKLVDQPALKNMTQTIEKETFRLEELTRSILDYSKQAEVKLDKIQINSAVSDSICIFRLDHHDVKIELSLPETSPEIYSDENAIKQILINLLKNAFEASNIHPVTVKVTASEDNVCIRVVNSGQISPEVLPHLFEPFISTKTSGYGLGLSISRKLAEKLNGKLTLKNLDTDKVCAELILPRSQ
ncbi:MAG: HAMP domain-containing sensor histidine kinase [Candidatus Riflebacteria bacterium]